LINSQLLYQLSYRGIEDAYIKVIGLLRQTEFDVFSIVFDDYVGGSESHRFIALKIDYNWLLTVDCGESGSIF
jgi:hypothetical protein